MRIRLPLPSGCPLCLACQAQHTLPSQGPGSRLSALPAWTATLPCVAPQDPQPSKMAVTVPAAETGEAVSGWGVPSAKGSCNFFSLGGTWVTWGWAPQQDGKFQRIWGVLFRRLCTPPDPVCRTRVPHRAPALACLGCFGESRAVFGSPPPYQSLCFIFGSPAPLPDQGYSSQPLSVIPSAPVYIQEKCFGLHAPKLQVQPFLLDNLLEPVGSAPFVQGYLG
ncbi:hypothetical protein H920_01152 [Fukomys damarensis]|uniref:Uncharacterized protein n=1 Tax=Fukomys damarensis TaxID=885580 RepID=A0A091E402_FUKDA|nr:hypothetical protein H920_01152 [Fukomys damarensis]